MLLHFFKFVFVKAAGLVEDLVLNADLAHVVQHGGPGNLVLVLAAVFGTDILVLEEKLGNFANPAHMFAGFLAAELGCGGQRLNHAHIHFIKLPVAPLKLARFFLDLDFELVALFVKLDDRCDPSPDNGRIDRLGKHIHYAVIVGVGHGSVIIGSGNQENGNLCGHAHFRKPAQNLQAIHDRHLDIQQDGAELVRLFGDILQGHGAVIRGDNLEMDIFPVFGIIVGARRITGTGSRDSTQTDALEEKSLTQHILDHFGIVNNKYCSGFFPALHERDPVN